MNYKSKIKELENEVFQMIENRKKWPPEKKQEIEAKEQEITKRVKEKLDKNNIRITGVFSFLFENNLLRDGKTRKTVLITHLSRSRFEKSQSVVSDPDTLEMLYVQTDVTRFMDVEDYFTPRD